MPSKKVSSGAIENALGKVVKNGLQVGTARHRGALEKCLDLAGEGEPLVIAVEEWFNAEAIAGSEQPPPRPVPDREGKHAVETGETVLAPLFVGVQDHFCVGATAKLVSLCQKFVPNSYGIVNLPIVGNPGISLSVAHRLMAGGTEVDDAEPPVAKAYSRIDPDAFVIRARGGLSPV